MVERLFSRAVRHSGLLPQILSLLLLLAAADSAAGAPERSVPDPFLKITETGLTLDANGVPLDRILTRIAELYGAPIALEGNLATPVTLSFRNLRLQEAIRRLVGEATFMILHEPPADDGLPSLPEKIWVYAPVSGKTSVRSAPVSAAMEGTQGTTALASDKAQAAEEPAPRDANQAEIETMAARQTPGDLDALGKVVAEHPDVQMRYLAVTLLGDIPDDRAVLAIERGLDNQDPMFRSYLVETLGRTPALDAVRSLGWVLYGERDTAIRLVAVQNLATRDEEPVRDFLGDAVEDADPRVRRAAAKALRSLQPRFGSSTTTDTKSTQDFH